MPYDGVGVVCSVAFDGEVGDIDCASHRKASVFKSSAESADTAEEVHSRKRQRALLQPGVQRGKHTGGCVLRRLMLPRADNGPPALSKRGIDPSVARNIAIQLLGP